ncbi:MAG: sulfite exporter TauE/SafE family protein, partial [Thermoleophilia bacterium]
VTVSLAITLLVLGLIGGFFSGWLGIGGGIIMAPLLLYVPQTLGVYDGMNMKVVAGLTMIQSLFATGSGVIVHRKFQHVSRPLVLWMGAGITAASLTGALLSKNISADVLLAIFATLALAAAAIMLIPRVEPGMEPLAGQVTFNRPLAVFSALVIGLVGGMVGQSGAFIIIPVLLYVLRIPTRTAIGCSLGITFLAALAGSAGKLATDQIDFEMALFCVVGALVGAQLGGRLSIHTRRRRLRLMLAALIAATAMRMFWDLATR